MWFPQHSSLSESPVFVYAHAQETDPTVTRVLLYRLQSRGPDPNRELDPIYLMEKNYLQ